MNTDSRIIAVNDGLSIHAEGRNEPVFVPASDLVSIIDGENDTWLRAANGLFYFVEEGDEEQTEGDTTLHVIDSAYGILDYTTAKATTAGPTPKFKRGDIVTNPLNGTENVVVEVAGEVAPLGTVYTVLQKGSVAPKGCSETPGALTLPEMLLTPTGQRFEETEVVLLLLAYNLAAAE